MNLYKFHSNPERLIGYDLALEQVPELAWDRYIDNIEELKKKEYLWKQDAHYAYWYARDVIQGRFPEGEAVIATSAYWAYWYARDIINGRFPEGEASIATNAAYINSYTHLINKDIYSMIDPL